MNIISCGPFVGSFFEEIMNFRPVVNWVEKSLEFNDIFIMTHKNRSFLYDKNIIPIFSQFSMDDSLYDKYKHKLIDKRLYNIIYKTLLKSIPNKDNKKIINYLDSYKNNVFFSKYQKIFKPIKINNKVKNNYIVFIPSKIDNLELLYKIYEFLKNNYENVIVIGDSSVFLQKENILNKKNNIWYEKYYWITDIITNAKTVICPLSNWTFLSNLQSTPVLSFGDGNWGIYKKDGIYNFDNQCILVNNKNILENIKCFLTTNLK